LQNETKVSVITSTRAVDDGLAYQFGATLARNLVAMQTISAAYHESLPANNDSYVYLAGEQEQGMAMDWAALYTELAKVAESVHGLRTEVALLKQSQATTTDLIRLHQEQTDEKLTRFEGLLEEFQELVDALQGEDRRIEQDLRNLPKVKPNPFWRQAIALIAGLLLSEIVLFFLMLWAFRSTGGLP
jgi:DNA repair exonuclease SbcCD ATPase subunit